MMLRILPLLMLPLVGFAQTNSNVEMPMGGTTTSEKQPLEIKRNATYNLEEIKVRWKKAALENCTGVPCVVEPPAPSFTCGTSTISDIDGNSYPTVLIGTQCWTQTNLKVTKYNDGTAIPLDATGGSDGITGGQDWSTRNTGAYTILQNESSTGTNATNFGFLYNWQAATDSKKLCPEGWHVPTATDWDALISEVGGTAVAGRKLKSRADHPLTSRGWTTGTNSRTNDYGFSALPGAIRGNTGQFSFIGNFYAVFWSATQAISSSNAIDYIFQGYLDSVSGGGSNPKNGHSIRCLKD